MAIYAAIVSVTCPRPVPGLRAAWGNDTFNNGAGMNRLAMATRFVKHNMPQGASFDAPQLTDDEAYDVSAYMLSKPRPVKANLEVDFPARWNKPVDSAFPPYLLGAPADQHRFGPFPRWSKSSVRWPNSSRPRVLPNAPRPPRQASSNTCRCTMRTCRKGRCQRPFFNGNGLKPLLGKRQKLSKHQAVPPTVSPSMRMVGWPTPTGTLWPSLPQVPTPLSRRMSLPIRLTFFMHSGPLPTSVAPLTGY